MGYDPCGTCIHNLKIYDCEKCADFWNDVGEWLVDAYNTITSVHLQQAMVQIEITTAQNEIIEDTANAVLDACTRSYDHQQTAQLQDSQALIRVVERMRDKPGEAIDFGLAMGGMTGTAYNIAMAVVTGTSGVGLFVSVVITGWEVYRAIKGLV